MATTFFTLLFWCILLLITHVAAIPIIASGREEDYYSTSEETLFLQQQEADRVKNLPGQPPVKFKHYAGYVKLRPHQEKALFYWFFEAQEQPLQKPLVLWLNGGPGCSSVGYGAARELGPFLVQDKERLKVNKFSWNIVANMIFLESPVGVGFSYTNNSKDLHELGDRVSAIDNYAFLLGWFKRFPSFRSHDFYIAGESYAGHYVPQLADLIYEGNKDPKKGSHINLKGFMVGNGVMNDITDINGLVDYAWSHAIISDEVYHGIKKSCKFNEEKHTKGCDMHLSRLLETYSKIDIYSIYSPVCLNEYSVVPPKLVVAPRFLTRHELWHKLPSGYDPCSEQYVAKYFNNKNVQKALHANITHLSYPYTLCSSVIRRWNDSPNSVLPVIQKLLHAGLRIWIYSGDTDGRVPVTSTRYSIKKMGLKIENEWRAWYDQKQQVAGWMEVYEGGLTFATIRGAGHQVPIFAPHRSLSLFTHFLSSHTLPTSPF